MELSSRDWKGIQLQSSFFFINNEALKKKRERSSPNQRPILSGNWRKVQWSLFHFSNLFSTSFMSVRRRPINMCPPKSISFIFSRNRLLFIINLPPPQKNLKFKWIILPYLIVEYITNIFCVRLPFTLIIHWKKSILKKIINNLLLNSGRYAAWRTSAVVHKSIQNRRWCYAAQVFSSSFLFLSLF